MPADGGIRFGQYVLLRRIARGGMAEVFLAQQRGLEGFDRRVAVKRILPHLADSPEFVNMFLGEARLAAQLAHPNIVHIYDFGKVDTDYFIAMEYVDGIHAGQVFKLGEREPRMPPTLVARIGADAATALHYAHALVAPNGKPLDLVHRDVSPANLMISFDGVVKLCDFGIAKAMAASESLTNPGQVKGKYAYMSPEQTIAAPLDGRSDVFSLAIVLWELLTGKTIVPRGDAVDAMRAIRDGRLPRIDQLAPQVPPPLARAITWALETKRERRATAAELAHALETFIKASPELATPMQLSQWVRARFPRDSTGSHAAIDGPAPRLGTSAAPGTSVAPGTMVGLLTPPSELPAASVGSEPGRRTAEEAAAARELVELGREIASRTPPRPITPERADDEPTRLDSRFAAPVRARTSDAGDHTEIADALRARPSRPAGAHPQTSRAVTPPLALDTPSGGAPAVSRILPSGPRSSPAVAALAETRIAAPGPLAETQLAAPGPLAETRLDTRKDAFDPSDTAEDGDTVISSGAHREIVPSAPAVVPTRIEARLPDEPGALVRGFDSGGHAAPPMVTATLPRPPRARRRYVIPALTLAGVAVASFLIAVALRPASRPASAEPVSDAAVATAPPDAARAIALVDAPPAPPAPVDAAPVDAAPRPNAFLAIHTAPRGATIRIGDQTRHAPASFALAPGRYQVIAELDGYQPERREITLERGEHRTYDIAFTHRIRATTPPRRAPGRLSVRTTPYSDVYYGTRKLGQSPFERELPAGTYTLVFRNPSHPTTTRTVKIQPRKVTKVIFALPR